MISNIVKSTLPLVILFLATANGADYVQVIKNTMAVFMKDEAVRLVANGFANQWELSLISKNLTAEFNNNHGVEWFAIIGPKGYVANFNAAPNSLLWLQFNELEIILYRPSQADDLDVIKSARIGMVNVKYIHTTVNDTVQTAIIGFAKEAAVGESSYRSIQMRLRSNLDTKVGGSWLVIVTSTAPNYDSNWDHDFDINYAMEFEMGSLRVFVYQKK